MQDSTLKAMWAVSAVMLLQAGGLLYGLGPEKTPQAAPLTGLPQQIGDWRMTAQIPMEEETAKVLRADDTVNRLYVRPGVAQPVNLFIAFFQSQRMGVTPHSPKNCLPGGGWAPLSSGFQSIEIPGRAEPIVVNRYLVAHGDQRTLVLYWYQGHGRVIASEYTAKIFLVLDSIKLRRSDTSIVRVVVPLESGQEQQADAIAAEFVRNAFDAVSKQLPG